MGYGLQAARKSAEGNDHPDRDAQFRYLAALAALGASVRDVADEFERSPRPTRRWWCGTARSGPGGRTGPPRTCYEHVWRRRCSRPRRDTSCDA